MALENLFGELATESKLELVRVLLSGIDSKLILNADDRLKVASMPANYDLQYMDITAAGQSFSFPVDNISNIVLQAVAYPAVSGHTAYFEASLNSTDGVDGNWFAIQAARTNANAVENYTGSTALAVTPLYGWELSVNAYKWVRVRCSAHSSGTMRWYSQAGSYATEPIPINQVSSVTASIRSSATWYTETTTNLASGATFTGSNRACGTTTAQYYGKARIRVYSSHSGTLTIESSRDSSSANFRSPPEYTNIQINAGETVIIDAPVIGYYYRCKFTNTGVATTTSLEILSAMFTEGQI